MRTVGDAMSAAPVIVEPSITLQAASARMLDAHAHAAVIVEDGRVRGVATARDVARAFEAGHDPTQTPVSMIAEPSPPFARPDEPLAEVHQRMRAEYREVIAVVGRKQEPLGLLEDPEAAA